MSAEQKIEETKTNQMCFKIEAKGVTPIPPPMRTATSDLKTSSAGAEEDGTREKKRISLVVSTRCRARVALTSEGP